MSGKLSSRLLDFFKAQDMKMPYRTQKYGPIVGTRPVNIWEILGKGRILRPGSDGDYESNAYKAAITATQERLATASLTERETYETALRLLNIALKMRNRWRTEVDEDVAGRSLTRTAHEFVVGNGLARMLNQMTGDVPFNYIKTAAELETDVECTRRKICQKGSIEAALADYTKLVVGARGAGNSYFVGSSHNCLKFEGRLTPQGEQVQRVTKILDIMLKLSRGETIHNDFDEDITKRWTQRLNEMNLSLNEADYQVTPVDEPPALPMNKAAGVGASSAMQVAPVKEGFAWPMPKPAGAPSAELEVVDETVAGAGAGQSFVPSNNQFNNDVLSNDVASDDSASNVALSNDSIEELPAEAVADVEMLPEPPSSYPATLEALLDRLRAEEASLPILMTRVKSTCETASGGSSSINCLLGYTLPKGSNSFKFYFKINALFQLCAYETSATISELSHASQQIIIRNNFERLYPLVKVEYDETIHQQVALEAAASDDSSEPAEEACAGLDIEMAEPMAGAGTSKQAPATQSAGATWPMPSAAPVQRVEDFISTNHERFPQIIPASGVTALLSFSGGFMKQVFDFREGCSCSAGLQTGPGKLSMIRGLTVQDFIANKRDVHNKITSIDASSGDDVIYFGRDRAEQAITVKDLLPFLPLRMAAAVTIGGAYPEVVAPTPSHLAADEALARAIQAGLETNEPFARAAATSAEAAMRRAREVALQAERRERQLERRERQAALELERRSREIERRAREAQGEAERAASRVETDALYRAQEAEREKLEAVTRARKAEQRARAAEARVTLAGAGAGASSEKAAAFFAAATAPDYTAEKVTSVPRAAKVVPLSTILSAWGCSQSISGDLVLDNISAEDLQGAIGRKIKSHMFNFNFTSKKANIYLRKNGETYRYSYEDFEKFLADAGNPLVIKSGGPSVVVMKSFTLSGGHISYS